MASRRQDQQQPQEEQDISPEAYMAQNPFGAGGPVSSGFTGVSENYLPPAQVVEKGQKRSVSGVVDYGNKIEPFYDLNTRPGEILASVDDVTRSKLINTLYSRGWYGGRKPQGGLGDNDREAMRNLLYISNLQGVTWNRTLDTIAQAPISGEGSQGRVVQVASTQDLMEIANRTALSTIGRKLSEAEARKFSAAYQQAQRGEAYGAAEQAPSAEVFFQNRIQQKYGADTEAYKYLSAMSKVANMLGGM